MFSNLFKKEKASLLDNESIEWIFEVFAWALAHFDAQVFEQETILVTPSNKHFPGRENNVHGMASLIFSKVLEYAGMTHWPFQLMPENEFVATQTQLVEIKSISRGTKAEIAQKTDTSAKLPITYSPFQLNDPEVLIGHYAHSLAHYLGSTAHSEPPGGVQNWPHTTELLAVYLGFGIIMANSAYTNKVRSCGSCAGPAVERSNFLSQYDITYALAVFCRLKNISPGQVKPYLKKSLWPFFKKASKDVEQRLSSNKRLQHFASLQLDNKP